MNTVNIAVASPLEWAVFNNISLIIFFMVVAVSFVVGGAKIFELLHIPNKFFIPYVVASTIGALYIVFNYFGV